MKESVHCPSRNLITIIILGSTYDTLCLFSYFNCIRKLDIFLKYANHFSLTIISVDFKLCQYLNLTL